jgi:hypothetical protein
MRTVALMQYSYDGTGRLRAAWDPRLDHTINGSTNHVTTQYTYNADGTLATLTPAGEEPWQFTYTALPNDPGAGRLCKVTRSALSAGTAVETLVYNVRISGAGAPGGHGRKHQPLGQSAVPVDATAVYPADIVPDGNPATGTLPTDSDDDRVTVTYMDTNGRAVNTMYPGGTVDATWYDQYGNTVRELDASNLAEAVGPPTRTPPRRRQKRRAGNPPITFTAPTVNDCSKLWNRRGRLSSSTRHPCEATNTLPTRTTKARRAEPRTTL